MMQGFPLIKYPPPAAQVPILVSIPHYGTQPLPEITAADYLSASAFPPLNFVFRTCLRLAGQTFGWHPSQYLERVNAPGKTGKAPPPAPDHHAVLFTGNRFGWFHCISARKTV